MLILIVVVMVKLVYIKGYYDNHHHHVLSVKYMVTMPYPALLFLLNLFSLLLRLPVGEWRIVMSVSIYLSTPTSQEPRVETLLNFLCIFSLSAAGCFSGSIAVHLLISGFLDYVTFAHNGQEEATRTGQYSKWLTRGLHGFHLSAYAPTALLGDITWLTGGGVWCLQLPCSYCLSTMHVAADNESFLRDEYSDQVSELWQKSTVLWTETLDRIAHYWWQTVAPMLVKFGVRYQLHHTMI